MKLSGDLSNVFVAFGSNVGDRRKNIDLALQSIRQHPALTLIQTTEPIQSKAETLDGKAQREYLNGVLQLRTELTPMELLKELKLIEEKLGRRTNEQRWQPRTIDLDILFFGNQVIQTRALKIPHPLLHRRHFVLKPLLELAPTFLHPLFKQTVSQLYQALA